MYIDIQIKMIRVNWTDHTLHAYERVSRSKWRIKLSYACGAEMFLENQPDDLIQCLAVGAFNSRKRIQTNVGDLPADAERPDVPAGHWRDVQERILSLQAG